MDHREVRILPFDLRVEEPADKPPKIVGHSAVFGVLSEPLWGFREKIQKGNFKDAVDGVDDVRALWNHDPNFILGRNTNGTLKLSEDDVGLSMELEPLDTQLVRDLVLAPIRRRDVTQQSFGFRALSDKVEKIDGETIRTLIRAKTYDVSPVTFPAYPQTDVAVRSLAGEEARGGKGTDNYLRLTDEDREHLERGDGLLRENGVTVQLIRGEREVPLSDEQARLAKLARDKRRLELLELGG